MHTKAHFLFIYVHADIVREGDAIFGFYSEKILKGFFWEAFDFFSNYC